MHYIFYQQLQTGQWHIRDVQPTAEGESQKVKLKVRVNIHGIITVASASLVEKKQDAAQNDNIEMENTTENSQGQDAAMDTNGAAQDQQQNGPDNQEVRDDEMKGEPQQKQSWTQKVGQWFSGVRVGSACVQSRVVCCPPSLHNALFYILTLFKHPLFCKLLAADITTYCFVPTLMLRSICTNFLCHEANTASCNFFLFLFF